MDVLMAMDVIMDFLSFCNNKWNKQLTAMRICCAKTLFQGHVDQKYLCSCVLHSLFQQVGVNLKILEEYFMF
jgi:hypothetical protein